MAVADTVKDIAHGIGFLIPGVSQEQALQTATNHRQRTALANMLENAYRHETDPSNFDPNDPEAKQRVSSLLDMQNSLQALGPFDSPKKLFAQYGEYVANHPRALMPAGPVPQGPSLAPPGPAGPGQTPGTQAVIPPVAPTTTAAAPGTSPVQPARQGGGSSQTTAPFPGGASIPPVSGTSTSQPSGIGNTGDQQGPAAFSIDANGVGPTPGIMLPTLPARPVPRLPQGMYTETPELAQTLDTAINASAQLQHPAVQAQAATDQALATLQSTTAFQNANSEHKLAMIKNAVGPTTWANLPDFYKTEIITSTFGVQTPGLGSMMQLRLLTPGSTGADLKKQYPGPETANLDDTTIYRAEYSPLQGLVIAPRTPEIGTAQTATGQIGTINKLNPAAGVTPISGTIAPALVTPQTATASQPTPGGGTATTKTEKKTIGGITPAPGAATTAPANAAPSKPATVPPKPTTPQGTTYSHPTPSNDVTRRIDTFGHPMTPTRVAQVNNATLALLRPNQSNAQLSEAIKVYEGSDKWLADQVRARLAQDQTPVISWDLGTSQRAQFSNQALTHMDTINSLIDQLDKEGKLGPIMSRWNDFMLGKVGAGDPEYAKLRNQIDLMTKALGVVHGGARGGSSIQLYQSFLDKINPAVMDASSLKAAMGVEKEWLTTYANPAKTTGVLPISPLPGSTKAKVWYEKTQTFK